MKEIIFNCFDCGELWDAKFLKHDTVDKKADVDIRIAFIRKTSVDREKFLAAVPKWMKEITDKWKGASTDDPAGLYSVKAIWSGHDANPHYVIRVHQGLIGSTLFDWVIDQSAGTAAHEAGHMLGNIDEYEVCRPALRLGTIMEVITGPVASRHFDLVHNKSNSAGVVSGQTESHTESHSDSVPKSTKPGVDVGEIQKIFITIRGGGPARPINHHLIIDCLERSIMSMQDSEGEPITIDLPMDIEPLQQSAMRWLRTSVSEEYFRGPGSLKVHVKVEGTQGSDENTLRVNPAAYYETLATLLSKIQKNDFQQDSFIETIDAATQSDAATKSITLETSADQFVHEEPPEK